MPATREGGHVPDPTTPAPTVPRGRSERTARAGALIVTTLGMVLAGVSYALFSGPQTCGGGLECLFPEMVALAFPVVGAPLVAILVAWWARIARGPLVGLAGTAIGLLMAIDVNAVHRGRPGAAPWHPWHPLAPLWVYLVIGALGGLAGLILVGRGPWPRWLRLVVLTAVVALAAAPIVVHAR